MNAYIFQKKIDHSYITHLHFFLQSKSFMQACYVIDNCRCTALNKMNLLLCNIFYPQFDRIPIYYTLTCSPLLCIALSQVFLMHFLFLVHFFYQNSQNVILDSIILETKCSFCNALMTQQNLPQIDQENLEIFQDFFIKFIFKPSTFLFYIQKIFMKFLSVSETH